MTAGNKRTTGLLMTAGEQDTAGQAIPAKHDRYIYLIPQQSKANHKKGAVNKTLKLFTHGKKKIVSKY